MCYYVFCVQVKGDYVLLCVLCTGEGGLCIIMCFVYRRWGIMYYMFCVQVKQDYVLCVFCTGDAGLCILCTGEGDYVLCVLCAE